MSSRLDKDREFLKTYRVVCWGNLLFTVMLTAYLLTQDRSQDPLIPPNLVVSIVLIGLMGFFSLPVLPVGFSFAAEITSPISVVMTTGIMMLFG